jgi:hypothetical protein
MAGRSQLPVQIMENQTRFDLNAAIENWRNELAAQPNMASDDRRELETHLRDAIAGFRQRGLNDEESFWLARRRVGQPQQLVEEFVKADPAKVWRERAFWMVLAALVLTLCATSVDYACDFFMGLMFKNSLNIGGSELFTGCFRLLFYWLPISACVLLLASGRYKFNSLEHVGFFRSRLRVCMTAILWVSINTIIFAWQSWPRFQSLKHTMAQLPSDSPFHGYTFWIGFWNGLLPTVAWPLLLVALLIWIMPPQSQNTPKRA